MIISRSILVTANGIISFIYMANMPLVCVCVCMCVYPHTPRGGNEGSFFFFFFFSFLRNLYTVLLFSIVVAPIYTPTSSGGGFPFVHTPPVFATWRFFHGGHADQGQVMLEDFARM